MVSAPLIDDLKIRGRQKLDQLIIYKIIDGGCFSSGLKEFDIFANFIDGHSSEILRHIIIFQTAIHYWNFMSSQRQDTVAVSWIFHLKNERKKKCSQSTRKFNKWYSTTHKNTNTEHFFFIYALFVLFNYFVVFIGKNYFIACLL